jgi:hypothetical protein
MIMSIGFDFAILDFISQHTLCGQVAAKQKFDLRQCLTGFHQVFFSRAGSL